MQLLNKKLLALRDEYHRMAPGTPQQEMDALFERFDQIPRDMMNANLDNVFG